MLDHLRCQIVDAFARTESVTLVTDGPAGLQLGVFPCRAIDLTLYLAVNRNSDQLLNLEQPAEVLASSTEWEIRGQVRLLDPSSVDPHLFPDQGLASRWVRIIALSPTRIHFLGPGGATGPETIDL